MLPIQVTAGNWNDGTIIACSPVVVGHSALTPRRVVLRDLGRRYSVHLQCWDTDPAARGLHLLPVFIDGEYFNKYNKAALAKAWGCFVERSNRMLAPHFHESNEK